MNSSFRDNHSSQILLIPRHKARNAVIIEIDIACLSNLRTIFKMIIPEKIKKDRGDLPLSKTLCRRIQHILYKDTVSPRRIIHQHMGHRTHQFSVLNNRAAAHECLPLGTTFFKCKAAMHLKYTAVMCDPYFSF